MNIAVEHIGIPAADPIALKDWYESVLGAKTFYSDGQTPPAFLLALGTVWFEIYQSEAILPERKNNKLAGFRHLALRVPLLDEAKSELERRGVVFTKEIGPAAGGGRVLYFEDKEGNLLHLVERAKDYSTGI